ncbi:MAG: hypothetical protein LBD48_00920 [Treponema sp.]|nr:hypothetical protein [Treponema sp.]
MPGDVNLDCTIDDFDSAFAKASFLTVKAAADSIEAAQNAGIDLENLTAAARSAYREIQFSDLGAYLNNRRSAMRTAARPDDFEEELALIADRYTADIAALVPAPDAAVNAGLIHIEDDEIVIGDDYSVPVNSLDGIAMIEVMNRVAAGEKPEDVVAEIQTGIDRLLVTETSGARGIYVKPENVTVNFGTTSGARWARGIVPYHFETGDYPMDEAAKKAALAAMAEWTAKTGGKIKFEEIEPNGWNKFCRAIGQTQYVNIGIYDLKSGTSGNSTIGSMANSRIRISPAYKTEARPWLHELGHSIGLIHEHQRNDRDKYITITPEYAGDLINYGTLPAKTLVAGLKRVKIWFISIYLPYILYIDYGKTVGTFDFDSIMLYPSPSINRKPAYAVNGSLNVNYNTRLSPTDINTVKQMY